MAKKTLDETLEDLKKTILTLDSKQQDLITYWVNDWRKFLKEEQTFDSNKLIKYKYGSIIKAHLGFNIGSEQGGLHYCIVLDKNNSKGSDCLTVMPLKSLKPGECPTKCHPVFEEYLGTGIFINKINFVTEKLQTLKEQLITSQNTDEKKLIKDEISKYSKELSNLERGSIALIGQIKTISKMRIYDPKKTKDILSKDKISETKMKEIENKIGKLYYKNLKIVDEE